MAQEDLKREMRNEEEIVRFAPGDVLFTEGDQGGDILLIESGKIEIYRTHKGSEISLAMMGSGELIGLFTCLNEQPRTASARAKEASRCKIIRQEKIKQATKGLPNWFAIILKEYGIRLAEIEESYMEYVVEMEAKKGLMMTPLTDGRFFCTVLAGLTKYLAITVDQKRYLVIEDAYDGIASLLGASRDKVTMIGDIFIDAGLLKVEVEQDKKRQVFPAFACEQLIDFTMFLAKARSGKTKRLVETRLPARSIKLARALVQYAQKKKLNTAIDIQIKISDLEEQLERTTGVKLQSEALEPLENFHFVHLATNSSQEDVLKLHPKKLGRTMAHLIAYQRLENFDYEKESKEKSVA